MDNITSKIVHDIMNQKVQEKDFTFQKTVDIAKRIIREKYPRGLKFTETEKRILFSSIERVIQETHQQKIDDKRKEKLVGILKKENMLELSNENNVFLEDIADDKTKLEICDKANKYLRKHIFFEIAVLFRQMQGKIKLLYTEEDFVRYLSKIISNAYVVKKKFLVRTSNEKFSYENIVQDIEHFVKENGGEIPQEEIFKKSQHLYPDTIIKLIKRYSNNLIEVNIGNVLWFKEKDSIVSSLPDNFRDKLNEIIGKSQELGLELNEDVLNTVLSLDYNCNFKKEYGLEESRLFQKIVSKYIDTEHLSLIYKKTKRTKNKTDQTNTAFVETDILGLWE